MNKIKSFFKLIRWTNLLMIAIMMLLVYYCLMSPLFATGIAGVLPSAPAFTLLLISMIFIVAAGYVINDYFDVEIDKINKPDRIIVSRVFTENQAKLFYILLNFIGLSCGLASSILTLCAKFYTLFAILVLLVCILYSYSSTYKKKLIIGNVIVSISVAFAVFLPWLFEMLYLSNHTLLLTSVNDLINSSSITSYILIYTAFAFLMTFMREIVKDAEDFKGDVTTHCRTIPIVLGIKKMNVVLVVLAVLAWLLLLYFQIVLFLRHSYIALGIMFLIWNSLPILIFGLLQKNTEINYHRYSVMLKIIMLSGILSMIFV